MFPPRFKSNFGAQLHPRYFFLRFEKFFFHSIQNVRVVRGEKCVEKERWEEEKFSICNTARKSFSSLGF